MKPIKKRIAMAENAIIVKVVASHLKKMMLISVVIIGLITTTQFAKAQMSDSIALNVQPCPCSSLFTGYYYTGPYYSYKPVLFSDMPLDQFVGYTIMDSIMAHCRDSFPTWQEQDSFIKSLTCEGDTLKYALKYLYRLADYNPFLYYNFLTSAQSGKMQPMSILPNLLKHVGKVCGFATQEVIKAEYILHVRVNKVEPFNYMGRLKDSGKVNYIHCEVLDTIKGQVLPNMNSNIVKVFAKDTVTGEVDSHTGYPVPVLLYNNLVLPDTTDFIYYYVPGMIRNIEEVDEEYIVFSFNMGACIKTTGQFHEIRPTYKGTDGGRYLIVNGNVFDDDNSFGWGEVVPLDIFKQNLQDLIDSIKNYGE